MLLDDARLQLAKHNIPKTVASHATALRGKREWVVSISGGVELDVALVVNAAIVQAAVQDAHMQSSPSTTEAWWWD